MSTSERFSHYLPLLLFTALTIIAAGLVLGVAAARLLGHEPWQVERLVLASATALLATGCALGFLHLGRKTRAHLSAAGLAHSWLSREAVLVAALAAATGASLAGDVLHSPAILSILVLCLASVLGLLTTIAIAKVYDLDAQPGWSGSAQLLTPPATALLLGSAVLAASSDGHHTVICLALLLGDAGLFTWRWIRLKRRRRNGIQNSFPRLARLLPELYLGRGLVLLTAIVSALLLGGSATMLLVIMMVLIDRLCLYAGAAKTTPSGEIAALKASRLRLALNETGSSASAEASRCSTTTHSRH